MVDPKVLVLDIETKPMLAWVWGTRDQNISLDYIKEEWGVIAFSAKWLGEPASSILYTDLRSSLSLRNERRLLQNVWDLLDKADVVITQNGKKFDSRKLNARFIMHGMQPPSPYTHKDTYMIVKEVADFTSNKLEYLTDKLCTKYKKLKHRKYPGFALWKACLAGKLDAWKSMERYNIHDVLATEEFYMKIRAWAPRTSPAIFHAPEADRRCRTCGTVGQMHSRGFAFTKVSQYRRYRCGVCKSWQQSNKREGK